MFETCQPATVPVTMKHVAVQPRLPELVFCASALQHVLLLQVLPDAQSPSTAHVPPLAAWLHLLVPVLQLFVVHWFEALHVSL